MYDYIGMYMYVCMYIYFMEYKSVQYEKLKLRISQLLRIMYVCMFVCMYQYIIDVNYKYMEMHLFI